MTDDNLPTFNWCVTFRPEPDECFEWLSAKAKHPAGAKQQIAEQIGEPHEWVIVTSSDATKSLKQLRKEQQGRAIGEFIDSCLGMLK